MPTVLTEVAFITNPAEEASLNDPAFQEKAAKAIADGIMTFLKSQ
jgi:N-acetylmuramoyl-L-alanine amidase